MILNNVEDNSSVVNGFFEIMHEVKNSIAVCRGYLDIIDSNRNWDMNKYLSVMRNEIDRSMDIISEFMLYRKINVVKEIIDINLLLSDLCDDMRLFINNKGIVFECEILDEDIYINGDYNKLKQVFINLIKNGLEAIDKENGKIEIKSYVKDNYYYVLKRDNGCGMNEETLKKIKDVSFTTKKNGNGIGVNICNQIIKEHDGEFVYSSLFGIGTEVIVKIPVSVL